MAYDPSIRSNLAKIVPGTFPCFGVQLKAKLLLFNPKPDMVLGNLLTRCVPKKFKWWFKLFETLSCSVSEGEVVKLTPNSIHAVVLGFSSAVIADDDIRDEFKHKVVSAMVLHISTTVFEDTYSGLIYNHNAERRRGSLR